MKAFPKGLYGHKMVKNNVVGLPGKTNRVKGACPVHMQTKIKVSFDPLPKYFA